MRSRSFPLSLVCATVLSSASVGQTTGTPPIAILHASLTAMVGQQTVQDATLSGQAEYVAGADDEMVPFTYQATSTGSSRMELPLSSGTLTETRLASTSGPTGQWQVGAAPVQSVMQHNLLTGVCWPLPAFIIDSLLTNPSENVIFVAQEGSLLHFTAYQQLPGLSSAAAALEQNITAIDLWLDVSTLLPAKVAFNTHPDSSAAINVPVLVEFSQYQSFSGVLIPSQVQKFENNTLMITMQLQSAVFNAGLPASTFTLN